MEKLITPYNIQHIKAFREFIQFSCGLKATRKLNIDEVQQVISDPIIVLVDDNGQFETNSLLMEELDRLLRVGRLDPSDWFKMATSLQSHSYLNLQRFSSEVTKLCTEFHHPLISDENLNLLYFHIAANSPEKVIDCNALSLAFRKYCLPPSKIKGLNNVSIQLKDFGKFMEVQGINIIDELKNLKKDSEYANDTQISIYDLEVILTSIAMRRNRFDGDGSDIWTVDIPVPLPLSESPTNSTHRKQLNSSSSVNRSSVSPKVTDPSLSNLGTLVDCDEIEDEEPLKRVESPRKSFIESFTGIMSSFFGVKKAAVLPYDGNCDAKTTKFNSNKPANIDVTPNEGLLAEDLSTSSESQLDVEERRQLEEVVKKVTEPSSPVMQGSVVRRYNPNLRKSLSQSQDPADSRTIASETPWISSVPSFAMEEDNIIDGFDEYNEFNSRDYNEDFAYLILPKTTIS